MKDSEKSKEQLIAELTALRQEMQAITALKKSDTHFAAAFNASPIPMSINTFPEGRYVNINESFIALSGYTRQEILGRTAPDLNLWTNAADFLYVVELLQAQKSIRNAEICFRQKSGEVITALYSAKFILFAGKNFVLSSAIDITALKKTETALRLSEERNQHLLNSIPDLLFRISSSGIFLDYHESESNLLYTSPTHFLGKNVKEILPEKLANTIMHYIHQALASDKAQVFEYALPINDVPREFEARIVSSDQKEVLFIVRDITELKHLQNEITRLDRLNLVGEIAAGIGHEIRNPMTTVRGFLQMLSRKQECTKYQEFFSLMIEELDRANGIISEFLSLARNKAVSMEIHNLNSIINSIAPLIESDATLYDKRLRLELNPLPDLLVDAKEIRQLILNLARNGLDAMKPKALLTIKTYQDQDGIVLAVQDEGPGIRPDLVDKLGTPFLTTKESGTGLGLPICYSIATRHNAVITVDTGPEGTTFFVRFS